VLLPAHLPRGKALAIRIKAFRFKNGTDHTPILLARLQRKQFGSELKAQIAQLLWTITAFFIHQAPQLFQQFGVVFADFFYHS
jgi:hypothetical protein